MARKTAKKVKKPASRKASTRKGATGKAPKILRASEDMPKAKKKAKKVAKRKPREIAA